MLMSFLETQSNLLLETSIIKYLQDLSLKRPPTDTQFRCAAIYKYIVRGEKHIWQNEIVTLRKLVSFDRNLVNMMRSARSTIK